MSGARWLSEQEQRAWRAYLRMVLLLDAEVARDLARESGLSMPDYHVLAAVSEAPEQRLRLSELANSIQWSASRLSHHVSRMQQRGLVARAECDEDGRGAFVVLTDKGLQAIKDAAPGHVESVRKHLINVLTAEQLTALTQIGEAVIANFGESCLQNYAVGASQSENRKPVSRS
jgi:DNA-binding MarR family transcriptional regulator